MNNELTKIDIQKMKEELAAKLLTYTKTFRRC